jgi:hypothetical protein
VAELAVSMGSGVVLVVVVAVLAVAAAVVVLMRGDLAAKARFPWGGRVDVKAGREPALPARPRAVVRDADSTGGGIAARSTGDATVERGKAKGDIRGADQAIIDGSETTDGGAEAIGPGGALIKKTKAKGDLSARADGNQAAGDLDRANHPDPLTSRDNLADGETVSEGILRLFDAGDETGAISTDRISIAVYLDTDDDILALRVLAQVERLASAVGGAGLTGLEVERGSIFIRAWVRLRAGFSRPAVQERLAKLERAAQLPLLDGPQMDITHTAAEAFGAVMEQLADVDRASIRVGSLLVMKFRVDGEFIVITRTLNTGEMLLLDQYPELQRHPEQLLDGLSRLAAQQVDLGAGIRQITTDD